KPLGTFIGQFEGQLISGKLENSGIPQPNRPGYVAKPDDWRYISGGIISYQPKWIPGLFVGLDRTFIINRKNMGTGFYDYLPIFSALAKKNYITTGVDEENAKRRDQRASFFLRWLLKESKAEF